jgi:SulP family sulfate permease
MDMTVSRFQPKLIEALHGYNRERFTADVVAGLTVAAVALPLAMAFAIASGLDPAVGLYTAIVAGFLVSLFGGSRVQIGGPAGAFIVVVYGIVSQYGVINLMLATVASGLVLLLMGWFRWGTLIRFIPVAVVIGFTNGIAVLIAASQIKELLGLRMTMPADFVGIVQAVSHHVHEWNPNATLMVLSLLAFLLVWQHKQLTLKSFLQSHAPWLVWITRLPGSIVVLVVGTAWAHWGQLPVDTIGSRFGGIAASLPAVAVPDWNLSHLRELWMPVLTLSLLGAIESLLCARVADNITGWRHDPNQELMAQGLANVITPFCGGMPATGTIARTVTNIKNGATSPVAGMTHAVVLLMVLWVAAPLANAIPLAALSAILLHVAYNMGEWRKFAELRQFRLPYRVTLIAVFLLTVLVDLTVAVQVGLGAACLTFIYRISSLTRMHTVRSDARIQIHALHGALFFAAVQLLEDLCDHLPEQAVVLDFTHVMYLDSSGMDALMHLSTDCHVQGVQLYLVGLQGQPLDILRRTEQLHGLHAHTGLPDVPAALQAMAAA